MVEMYSPVDLYSVPATSCFHGKDDSRISDVTIEIVELASRLVEKLNERSATLARGGQFHLALSDAATMRVLAPRSSVGYLRTGAIYEQQGNQRAAVGMYDKGLETVTPSDHGYTNLEKRRAEAMHADTKCVDFITQLPPDIVTTSITPRLFENNRLDADKPCPYLYVSHAWQQRLLASNPLTFIIHEDVSDSIQVIKFASHIKSLVIPHNKYGTEYDPAHVLLKASYPNLVKLILHHRGDRSVLNTCLTTVGGTLTWLKLIVSLEDPIDLRFVLDHCPQLVSLDAAFFAGTMANTLTHPYPNLKDLYLRALSRHAITEKSMLNIVGHLPSLSSLNVGSVPSSRLLPTLHHYCPNMKLLAYGDDSGDRTYKDLPGLQKVSIGQSEIELNPDDLISILSRHWKSLEKVILRGRIKEPVNWRRGFVFERLTYLEIDARHDALLKLAASIIRLAPHLTAIKMFIQSGDDHHQAFVAMTELKYLKSLSPRCIAPYSNALYYLIQHHVNLGDHSSLQEIRMLLYPDMPPCPWLRAIAQLVNLRHLEIRIKSMSFPRNYVAMMDVLAQGCLALEHLELNCGAVGLPEKSLVLFGAHPRIKHLAIVAESISNHDIIAILSMPNLQCLDLLTLMDDLTLETLKKNIPIVNYMPFSPSDRLAFSLLS